MTAQIGLALFGLNMLQVCWSMFSDLANFNKIVTLYVHLDEYWVLMDWCLNIVLIWCIVCWERCACMTLPMVMIFGAFTRRISENCYRSAKWRQSRHLSAVWVRIEINWNCTCCVCTTVHRSIRILLLSAHFRHISGTLQTLLPWFQFQVVSKLNGHM